MAGETIDICHFEMSNHDDLVCAAQLVCERTEPTCTGVERE
jgi:hypothetical protein